MFRNSTCQYLYGSLWLDYEMQKLKETVLSGWPEKKHDVLAIIHVRAYWMFREEISVEGELIYKNDRVIIPKSMRKAMLVKIPQSHQGIQKKWKLSTRWYVLARYDSTNIYKKL